MIMPFPQKWRRAGDTAELSSREAIKVIFKHLSESIGRSTRYKKFDISEQISASFHFEILFKGNAISQTPFFKSFIILNLVYEYILTEYLKTHTNTPFSP
jgi:hypothetical protein